MAATADNAQDDEVLELNWDYWAAQDDTLQALESGDYDLVVFRGGYGSGKTVLGARATIEYALEVPKSDNLVLAPDAAKGGPSTYKGFFQQLPGENVVPGEGGDPENSPLVDEYHGTKRRLTFYNGSIVRLGSADVWNRYAGSEFNFIWCDEVAHYTHTDLYDLNRMLLSRQRTEGGPNVTLWTSTGNGYNQFFDFVELQEMPDGSDIPTRIQNVLADSRENPFLPEKDKLARQFEGTAAEEQGLMGGFAAAEGRVYEKFNRPTHVVPAGEVGELTTNDPPIYGYDAGWDDPRVFVEWRPTHYGQWVAADSFHESDTTIEDAIEWLPDTPSGTIYCEHEPEHIYKMEQEGWDAEKADKSLDEGIPHVRGMLKPDDSGRPGLLVSDDCSELVQEFLSYQKDEVGTKAADDHELDASRYALFTHQKPADDDGDADPYPFR